jgi:hypothetical protein
VEAFVLSRAQVLNVPIQNTFLANLSKFSIVRECIIANIFLVLFKAISTSFLHSISSDSFLLRKFLVSLDEAGSQP